MSQWVWALIMAILVIGIKCKLNETCVADNIMWCGVLVSVVGTLNFTIIIPDSYRFARALGQDEAYSGKIVGAYMLADVVGALIIYGLGKIVKQLWKHCRLLWTIGLALNTAGAAIYLKVTHAVPNAEAETMFFLSRVLLGGRFISGIGNGMCSQMTKSMVPHLVDLCERPYWAIMTLLGVMVGLGFGPVLSAVARWFDRLNTVSEHFETVGYLQIVSAIGVTLVVLISGEPLKDFVDKFSSDPISKQSMVCADESDAHMAKQIGRRRLVVIGCLTMSGLRAFTVSGLEVATSLILEESYSWSRISIGIATGTTFLMCVPLKLIHTKVQTHFQDVQWVRILAWFALFAAFLVTNVACSTLTSLLQPDPDGQACAWILLLADSVLFPTLYLSDGVSVGIMQQHLLPGYFLLDPATTTLLSSLSMATLGRYLGPWQARATFEEHGRDGFAFQQMSATLIFILIFEVMAQFRISFK